MPRRREPDAPPLTDAEGEVRELGKADMARLRPAEEALPAALLAALPRRRPGQRGPQKTPTKRQVTLRLDPDVVEHYRAKGEGWQSRINDDLKKLNGLR